jgi:AAA family ATP:ADP antiporter
VQILSAIGQATLTARVIRRAGLTVTLAAVPAVSVIGFMILGFASVGLLPLLATFIVFNIARRATEFTFTNPSRKILFTVISREDKYKATNFLETFVYRAGDQLAVMGYAGLALLGLSLAGISWIAVAFSLLFVAIAIWLARRQAVLAAAQMQKPVPTSDPPPVSVTT